jgi:hypothetical protein
MRLTPALCLPLLLAACVATAPVSMTERSIVVEHSPGKRQEAADVASVHCARYNRKAALTGYESNQAETAAWSTFHCVN